MSLSKIFKSQSSVVFQDIVSLHPIAELDIKFHDDAGTEHSEPEIPRTRVKETSEQKTLDSLQHQMQSTKAQIQAEANEMMQMQLQAYQLQIHENITQELNHQYDLMYKSHLLKTQAQVQNLLEEVNNYKKSLHAIAHEQILQLAIVVAEKIIKSKIEADSACLSPMILAAIQDSEHLNIQSVELSAHAHALVQAIESQLKEQDTALILNDGPIDHIVLNGEIGNYDISIPTQLNNAKRVINS